MGGVVSMFREAAFEPEVTRAMGDAFELACETLNGRAVADEVRVTIAQRIIQFARSGEHDPKKLCQGALDALPRD
jgi:hypothetical protein